MITSPPSPPNPQYNPGVQLYLLKFTFQGTYDHSLSRKTLLWSLDFPTGGCQDSVLLKNLHLKGDHRDPETGLHTEAGPWRQTTRVTAIALLELWTTVMLIKMVVTDKFCHIWKPENCALQLHRILGYFVLNMQMEQETVKTR